MIVAWSEVKIAMKKMRAREEDESDCQRGDGGKDTWFGDGVTACETRYIRSEQAPQKVLGSLTCSRFHT